MSLLRRAQREARTGSLTATLTALGLPTRAGGRKVLSVSNDRAMRQSAAYACVTLIADLLSTLPFDAYRKKNGQPTPVEPQPLLLVDPSTMVDEVAWKRQILVSWLQAGNAFGDVADIGRDGWPTRIESIDPSRVTARRAGKVGPIEWRLDNKDIKKWPLGRLWHAPGIVVPGEELGVSVLEYARLTIGLAAAATEFGADWFVDGAHPSALLKTDKKVDETEARVAKERFVSAIEGREPVVMGLGLEYQAVSTAANESQFLETIKATSEDVARFFFPSFVLNVGNASITYQNVEQRSLNLLTMDLDPWIVKLERALGRILPGGASGQYVKAKRDALLRTDAMTRWKIHDLAVRLGARNRDEVRAIEEEPPIPDDTGAEFLWPPVGKSNSTAGTPSEEPT